MESPLAHEVKWFYKQQYQLGLETLQIIEKYLHIAIPECEATAFAFHFINMQRNTSSMKEAINSMEVIKDIIQIIRYHPIKLDDDSFDFTRLVTHLQYFVKRLIAGQQNDSNGDLNSQVKQLYPKATACVARIGVYIQKHFGRSMTEDEETYLILHIQKNISNGGE